MKVDPGKEKRNLLREIIKGITFRRPLYKKVEETDFYSNKTKN